MTKTRHAIPLHDMARRSLASRINGLSGISMSFAETEYRNTLQRLLDMKWAELYEHVRERDSKSTDAQDLEALMDSGVLPRDGTVRDLVHMVDIWPLLSSMASEAADIVARKRAAADMSEPLRRVLNTVAPSIRDDYDKPAAPDQWLSTAIYSPGSDMDSRLSRIEECLNALCDRCDSLEDQIIGLRHGSAAGRA